jgi:TonB family protein
VPFLPLGAGLDEEAIKAVKKLKFNPAKKNNQAVADWVMVAVEFHLRF